MGGCQSGRKVVAHNSNSDLPLVCNEEYFFVCLFSCSEAGLNDENNQVRYSILAPTSFNSVKISVKKLGSELIRSIDVLRRLTILTHLSQKRSLSDSTRNGFSG